MRTRWKERLAALSGRCPPWLARSLVAALIGFSILCGYLGIDFGYHWDEPLQASGVKNCIDKLMLLPGIYNYGNIYFLLGLAVVAAKHLPMLPAFVREMIGQHDNGISNVEAYSTVTAFQRSARTFVSSEQYQLQNRMLFFCLSSLAVLWVYLTVRRIYPQRYLGALAAAAFVAGSWELHYHARFIAVDALLAQAVAAELFLIASAWYAPTMGRYLAWYASCAAGAAVAFTCKAPGLVVLGAVVLLALLHHRPARRRDRAALALLGVAIFAAVTIVIQPSFVVDTLRNVTVLGRIAEEYAKTVSPHPNVTSGVIDRVTSFLAWLVLAVPSPYAVVSAIFSVIVAIGLIVFARRPEHRRLAILGAVIVVPTLSLALRHPLLIVRNYLLLIPFAAIGFGVGLSALHDWLRARVAVQRALVAAIIALFVLDERWLYAAGQGIRHATSRDMAAEAAADLLRSPEPLRLSPRAFAGLGPLIATGYRCSTPGALPRATIAAPADRRVVIHAAEHDWVTNVFGFSRHFYGTREINYDWYATWIGRSDRSPILIISAAEAARQKVPVARFAICDPAPPRTASSDAGATRATARDR